MFWPTLSAATTATPWAHEGDLVRIGKFMELVKAQGIVAGALPMIAVGEQAD